MTDGRRGPSVGPRADRNLIDRISASLRSIYSAYALVVGVLLAGACWIPVAVVPMSTKRRWSLVRRMGSLLLKVVATSIDIEGRLAPRGAIVIVANHPSVVDGLAIMLATEEPMIFLAGAVFARQPLIGRFLKGLGCEFVERGAVADAVAFTEHVAQLLRSGRSVASFPEGGLEPSPELGAFHLGAFRAAAIAEVPVVPVGISGTREIVAPRTRSAHRGTIRVKIGSPIVPAGADWRSLIEVRDAAYDAVNALLHADPLTIDCRCGDSEHTT